MKILAMTCCCVDVYPEKGVVAAGGNALNLAANCTKMPKTEVHLMGNIGTDSYAEEIKKAVHKYDINHQHLYEVDGVSANHIIHIATDGDRYFTENSWTDGVYGDYRISPDDEIFMNSMDAIATTCYDPNFKKIIEISRNSDFILAVDFHDEKVNNEWEELFDAIQLFFISGRKEELPKLMEWSKKYKTVFVATLGKDGSVAYLDGLEYICPAVQVDEVVDTTGCGDTYQAGFIASYCETGNIETAMKEGSRLAAITLSHMGGF